MKLRAPFPYYGGKSHWAAQVWDRLGDPDIYVEPFAGSLAVLLSRPGHIGQREIVGDLNGHVANFWRSITQDPEAVAYWADYPSVHQDLTARHRWLNSWAEENSHRISEDADYCDAKAAGWWCWGISNWIGKGWCIGDGTPDKMPRFTDGAGAHKIRQSRVVRNAPDIVPMIGGLGGLGVSKRRVNVPLSEPPDIRPCVPASGARGVQKGRREQDGISEGTEIESGLSPNDGTRLFPWFRALGKRLEEVIVINRSWESCVTKAMLADYDKGTIQAILLDPPYIGDNRTTEIYANDTAEQANEVANASWQWALEHGDRFRIAYCCHLGDFEPPDDWEILDKTFSSIKKESRRDNRDCIMFSPACLGEKQRELF